MRLQSSRICFKLAFFLLCISALLVGTARSENADVEAETSKRNFEVGDNSSLGEEYFDKAASILKESKYFLTHADLAKKREGSNLISRLYFMEFGYIKELLKPIFKISKSGKDEEKIKEPVSNEVDDSFSKKRMEAIELLKKSASYDYRDALIYLANIYMYSLYGEPRNLPEAVKYYEKLTSISGDPDAYSKLGTLYGTGVGGVEFDYGLSLLYHKFAADSSHQGSLLTLGYRYLHGIGVVKSCELSEKYYRLAADQGIKKYLDGPLGGRTLPKAGVRLSVQDGGMFRGRTVISSHHQTGDKSVEELLEYYIFLSNTGDLPAKIKLAQLYYAGTRYVNIDHARAFKYFSEVLESIFNLGDKSTWSSETASLAGVVYYHLGYMYMRGEGTEQDMSIAANYFMEGSKLGNNASAYWFAKIQLTKQENPGAIKKALDLLKETAESGNMDAAVSLGERVMDQGKDVEALPLFKMAADSNNLLGIYRFARLQEKLIIQNSCEVTVGLYKQVAERTLWDYEHLELGYTHLIKDRPESAALQFLFAAEMGLEIAQQNLAWMIDNGIYRMPIFDEIKSQKGEVNDPSKWLALIYWSRSANQGNVISRIRQGDYYFYGWGQPKDVAHDYIKAAGCYRLAAESDSNSLAMWNVAWMHENGLGVPKDYHLAKRWYDSALTHNSEAYLPVTLSLINLSFKYVVSYILNTDPASRGNAGLIAFFQPIKPVYQDKNDLNQADPENNLDTFQKKVGENQVEPGTNQDLKTDEAELDAILAKRKPKNSKEKDGKAKEEDDESSLFLFDADISAFMENIIILALCFFVGYLVYFRQFRNRQNDNNQNQNLNRQQ